MGCVLTTLFGVISYLVPFELHATDCNLTSTLHLGISKTLSVLPSPSRLNMHPSFSLIPIKTGQEQLFPVAFLRAFLEKHRSKSPSSRFGNGHQSLLALQIPVFRLHLSDCRQRIL